MKISKLFLIGAGISLVLIWGCLNKTNLSNTNQTAFMNSQNQTIQNGSVVSFDYIGSFPSGEIFDTSLEDVAKQNWLYITWRDYKPLEVEIGKHQIIPGLENALIGHKKWDEFEITIPPEQAYGPYNENLKATLAREQFGTGALPQVGDMIVVSNAQWIPMQVKVLEVNQTGVVIDLNNPMAGKTLVFKIFVRDVK